MAFTGDWFQSWDSQPPRQRGWLWGPTDMVPTQLVMSERWPPGLSPREDWSGVHVPPCGRAATIAMSQWGVGGPKDEATTTGELCAQWPAGKRDVAAGVGAHPRPALLGPGRGTRGQPGGQPGEGPHCWQGRRGAGEEGQRQTLKSPAVSCTQHHDAEADAGAIVLFDNGGTAVRSEVTRLWPRAW